MVDGLSRCGWARFGWDSRTADWTEAAREAGLKALQDPALAHWYDCENAWFIGVDALPNDTSGALAGRALEGPAIDALRDSFGPLPPLHPAQLSVIFPGYPKPRRGESAQGIRYRLNRDAAHVDGVLAEGAARRRFVREPHAWVLGLPLTDSSPEAAPMVVWEGSHKIMAAAFRKVFDGHPPAYWGDVDVTEVYQAARRAVFESCARVIVHARPGEAYLVHRLALHGVAPWQGPEAPGRMIAYFRPEVSGGMSAWLDGI